MPATHCCCHLSPAATGAADERRQEQCVAGSGGGGDVERVGKGDKEGGEREREREVAGRMGL